MDTIKLGSKGESVKVLLKLLNLTVDGVFGKDTESKVKEFLKSKGLTPDGIVGSKTWNVLLEINIINMPLKVHITKSSNRPITYLVIHFTAGGSSKAGKAKAAYNTFTTREASADFVVDDEEIVLFNPDLKNYYCWAVGGKSYGNKGGKLYGKATNKNCIHIEVCSTCKSSNGLKYPNNSEWSFTESTLKNTCKLAKYLISLYNIPLDHVIRHYDVTGKLCPGIIGWNDEPIYNIDGTKTKEVSTSKDWNNFKLSLC